MDRPRSVRVLIAGCGYLGTAAGSRLAARGDIVFGLRRGASSAGFERLGIRPIAADLSDPSTLGTLPPCDAAVLSQAPSGSAGYFETYVEGTRNLIASLQGSPRVLFVSSTRVYGDRGGAWVDEGTPPAPELHSDPVAAEKAGILLQAESLVLQSRFESLVLRLGGLYGPGRERPAGAPKAQNRIQVEAAASAVILLLERGRPGEVYLGVEDPAGPEPAQGKRCSNRKLKALGWKP